MDDDKGGYRQINKSLNICAFSEYLQGQTASLTELADVEQLTPRVLRILGQNPGKFTYQGTNTFVIGTGHDRILVDTGGGEPAWVELVEKTLTAMDIQISYVLLTHWHGDHTGGVAGLLRLYPELRHSIYKNQPETGQQDMIDGQTWTVDGATVYALHAPGHSDDHMCFILEEEHAMFTGDNVLGTGTSAVEDLGTFMNSLRKMSDQGCPVGYPAHGEVITNLPLKFRRELGQKIRRESQIVKALSSARSCGERSVTVEGLVTLVYGTSLDAEIRTLALEPFTEEVLRKLAGDGKVGFEKRGGKKRWYSVEAM